MLKKFIGSTFLRFSRWTVKPTPIPDKAILIGAPHTSNWDGILVVMAFWSLGQPYRFLAKDSLTKMPILGPAFKAVGAIGVDRSQANGLVEALVTEAKNSDRFTLAVTPKGTRSKRDYWKSGFYRIALETGLPIKMGYIDRNTMTFGWEGEFYVTGDVKADMDKIRAYYDGKVGVRPELTSVPRLRAEDNEEARAYLLRGFEHLSSDSDSANSHEDA